MTVKIFTPGTPKMRNRPSRKAKAKEGVVVDDETGPRKSIKARKRKYEDRQIDEVNTLTKGNKQRKFQNDQSTNRKASSSSRGPRNQSMAKGNPRRKRNETHDEKIKRPLNKSEEYTTQKSVLQTKEPKRVTRSSTKSADNSKKGVKKDSDSKLRQQIKGTRERKGRLPKQTNKTRKNKQPKTSTPQGKGFVVKKSNPKKEKEQRQSTQAERIKKLKANKNRDNIKKRESRLINKTKDTETSTTHTSDEYFSDLFLKKISVQHHPVSGCMGEIHEISVSHDNLLWVNHLYNTVHLQDSAGEILRSFKLDARPVFSCCTPGGDLLFTQGYGGGFRPLIFLLSREGDSKVLANLSSYATYLFGILYKDERIYVAATCEARRTYFIIKLDMNGKVESVYKTEKAEDSINQLLLLNGQIVAVRINDVDMIPLEKDVISSVALNTVNIKTAYSGSASTDNLGNVILGSDAQLFIVNPSLERMHKLNTDISGGIISTAVDQQNQLWFGTADGKLYSTKYLK